MNYKSRKYYTKEFKAQAVELLSIGKPASEVAKELTMSVLRRENAVLRQENDILKKAAIILGTRARSSSEQ